MNRRLLNRVGLCPECGRLLECAWLNNEEDFIWILGGEKHCSKYHALDYELTTLQ